MRQKNLPIIAFNNEGGKVLSELEDAAAKLGFFHEGKWTEEAAQILLKIEELKKEGRKHLFPGNIEKRLRLSGQLDLTKEEVIEKVKALAQLGLVSRIGGASRLGATKEIKEILLTKEGQKLIDKIKSEKNT